jgi:hypothetical protein
MTSEAQIQEEIEVTDAPEPEEVEVAVEPVEPVENIEEKVEEKTFNPKTDKVEFDKPEQQERFNEVFRQMKKSDARNQMLTDFLQEQQRQLDELRSGFTQIKTEKTQLDSVEAEKTLMSKIAQARADGDDAAYDKALSEYVTFASDRQFEKKFEQKVNELTKKEQESSQADAAYIESLMSEKDETGSYKRPWLQESHADFNNAIQQLAVIAYKYTNDPQQLKKSLTELDQIMGTQMKKEEPTKTQSRAPNPMQGSNLTNQKPKGTIKMTRKEAEILKKLERHSGKKIDLKKYEARRSAMNEKAGR